MVRRFFKDSAFYGVATILSKGMTILMVPIYTAYLKEAEIGLLDLLLGGVAMMTLFVGLDISNALAREYGSSPDPVERRRFSSTALWFTVFVFGIIMACSFAGGPALAALTGDPTSIGAIHAAGTYMCFGGIYVVVVQQLRWMMRPVVFGLVSIAYTLVSLLVTVALVSGTDMKVDGVLYGMSAGALAGIILSMIFARSEFGFTFDMACFRKMALFSIPLVPSSLAVVVSQYISRFVIENEQGRDAVGVFGVGARLAGMAGLVMLGFGSALTPLIYAGQNDPATPGSLARIFRIFIALASMGLGGLVLFTPEILALLTKPSYMSAAPLMALLSPSVLLVQMYIFAPGPWIKRRTWWVAFTNAATAALAVVLNLLLVPGMGLMGAATATLIASAFHFGLSMAVSQHFYPVPHKWRQLSMVAAAGGAVMLLAQFLPASISVVLVTAKLLIVAALLAGIVFLGGIERELVMDMLKKLAFRVHKSN